MENSSQKIFTNKTITVATFFGGPLAAGLLISKNYSAFGKHDAARKTVYISFAITILLFTAILLIPESFFDNIPNALIPAIYTPIIAFLTNKLQGREIKEHIDQNGQLQSNWIAAAYGVFGLAINVIFIGIIQMTMPVEGYESSVKIDKNIVLYHNNDIGKDTVQLIANNIKQSEFLKESTGADLFLNTEDNFYRLKFVIGDMALANDSAFIHDYNVLEDYLNKNLNLKKRIEIGFTDMYLEEDIELKSIEIENEVTYNLFENLQPYHISVVHTIYYNPSMPIEDVKKLEHAMSKLVGYFPRNERIDLIFINTQPTYTIKFFVSKNFWNNQELLEKVNSTVEYINDCGISKKINIVLVDIEKSEEKQL